MSREALVDSVNMKDVPIGHVGTPTQLIIIGYNEVSIELLLTLLKDDTLDDANNFQKN